MREPSLSAQCSLALLALLSATVPGYDDGPPADALGQALPPEAATGPTERYPAEPVIEPLTLEASDDDLQDFGITGTPVVNGAPATDGGPSTPPPAAAPPAMLEGPPERIVWNKTPIRITLPVGEERWVQFPADVRVGLPSPPPPGLRTQSIDATVYWRAAEPFATTRVQVQELATGQVYLLDLKAEPGGSATPVQILRPRRADVGVTESGAQSEATLPPAPTHATVSFVQLTRQAAQQLYAPRRLAREAPGIHRVPVKTDPVPLLRGARVEAAPLVAWRGGDHYVTAVRLRNRTAQAVILDPRALRGQWSAATFQHARLLPAGDEADTTCVYLISTRPFAEALRGLD